MANRAGTIQSSDGCLSDGCSSNDGSSDDGSPPAAATLCARQLIGQCADLEDNRYSSERRHVIDAEARHESSSMVIDGRWLKPENPCYLGSRTPQADQSHDLAMARGEGLNSSFHVGTHGFTILWGLYP